jgi:HlyD family secretion protein
VINAQDALEDAQNQVDRLAYGRGNQEQVELARANYLLALDKVDQMQAIYEQTSGKSDEDPAKALALSNLAGAENARDRALANLNWYQGERSTAEVAEKEADLALAQARQENARRTLAELQNPTTATQALAQARVADAQKALDELLAAVGR